LAQAGSRLKADARALCDSSPIACAAPRISAMGKASIILASVACVIASPAEAAGLCTVEHGRMIFSIKGLSDSCCDAGSDVVNWVSKNMDDILQIDNGDGRGGGDEWAHRHEAEAMEKAKKVASSCCNSEDENVLATLVPEEKKMLGDVAGNVDMMCTQIAAMGPSLQLFSLVARKFTGDRKEGAMTSSWPVIAAVVSLAGGLAGMVVTLTLKLRQRGSLNEQLIIA